MGKTTEDYLIESIKPIILNSLTKALLKRVVVLEYYPPEIETEPTDDGIKAVITQRIRLKCKYKPIEKLILQPIVDEIEVAPMENE